MLGSNAPDRAKWEVIWVAKGRVIRKKFGTDLMSAVTLFQKVKAAGRPGATLRCCNMGFPPPAELLPRRVRGKRHGKIVEGTVSPLRQKNAEGIFWDPYCMQLRRFKTVKDHRVEGVDIRDEVFACPLCGISTKDHNVRKYNPLAIRITYEIEAKGTRAAPKTTQARKAAYRRKKRAAT